MKAFAVTSLLAAAAVAEPQVLLPGYTGFNGYTSGLVGGVPLVAQPQPSIYYQPTLKFAEQKKFDEKKVMEEQKKEKFMEEKKDMKVETYMAKKPEQYKYVAAKPAVAYTTYPYGQQVAAAAFPSYVAQSAGTQHTVFKREAEAEADAFLPYGALPGVYNYNPYTAQKIVPSVYNQWYNPQVTPVVYKQQFPYVAKQQTYANDFVKPENYASKGQYFAQSAGATHIAKREAEADAFLPYNAVPMYNQYAAAQQVIPSVYNYNPYAAQKIVPAVYSKPAVYYNQAYNYAVPQLKVKSYSNDAVKAENYAAKGQYVAENAGALHIAKREAEAEADAQYLLPATTLYKQPIVPATTLYKQPITTYNQVARTAAFPFNTYNTAINAYPSYYNNFGYVY